MENGWFDTTTRAYDVDTGGLLLRHSKTGKKNNDMSTKGVIISLIGSLHPLNISLLLAT